MERRIEGVRAASVVVFLKKGCPCNARCMPALNAVARGLKGQVPMVGFVVGASATAGAGDYGKGLGASFPLRADAKGRISARAGAVCSLDFALVSGDGRVLRLWEGIGKRTVAELETEIAARLGKNVMFDGRRFDEVVQTGCCF